MSCGLRFGIGVPVPNPFEKNRCMLVRNDISTMIFNPLALTYVLNAANSGYAGGGGIDGVIWKRFKFPSGARNTPIHTDKYGSGNGVIYVEKLTGPKDNYNSNRARVIHCVGPSGKDIVTSAKHLDAQYRSVFDFIHVQPSSRIDIVACLLGVGIFGYNVKTKPALANSPNSSLNILLKAWRESTLYNNPNISLILNVYGCDDPRDLVVVQ